MVYKNKKLSLEGTAFNQTESKKNTKISACNFCF